MTILLLLLPISAGLLGLAAWAFIWSVNHGQFEALDQHALDIFEDEGSDAADAAHTPTGNISSEQSGRNTP